ncbi:hypothetical protein [Vibrio rarus]|uniref:hypothetical protein n=1 Tax=Vibrio rarus TaxID=413403 RepID=UPI0021C3D25F|nr:hypothetical protein [Vibrio rarus]
MEVVANESLSVCKELLPIIASLITAISTLLGVFIASHFNHKNNQKIVEKNIAQDKLKINLSKIEEIYEHFSIWQASIDSFQMDHLVFYSGNYTEEQFYDAIKKESSKGVGDNFRRLQALCDIHFPELKTPLKDVLKSRDCLSECYFGKKQSQGACDRLISAHKEFEQEAEKFKSTLSSVAKNL